MLKTFNTIDNHQFTITIPEPSDIDSFFVFALPKSGSVMQDKIIESICKSLNIPAISIPKAAFAQGIKEDDLTEEIGSIFARKGYGFYGYRKLSNYLNKVDFNLFKKVVLVRDPRDIMVSHYFSMKESHSIAKGKVGEAMMKRRERLQNLSIDDYVVFRSQDFLTIFDQYSQLENPRVFRYEDVVFNKSKWIGDILDFLELSLEENQIEKIAKAQDIFPTEEKTSAHIRQVAPGDHKRKLKDDTIEKLNNIFKEVLIRYNYSF